MQKHEKLSEGEELLAQVLEECLEEDLSFVPPEREIARKHRFSENFEQEMQRMLDEISAEFQKKEIRRHLSPRYGQWAACILVFCVCGWLFYHVSGQIGNSSKSQSADTAGAPAEAEAVITEDADLGTGSLESAEAEESALEAGSPETAVNQFGRDYCDRTIYPAGVQEVPERLESVTTLVNCPVLDENNPVLMLTIGNTGEEDILYLDRYDLEVWLEDAWYRIPSESESEEEWLTLEAGMAVDEEIDLSEYQIDYDASQYRLITDTDQGLLSVEFTFEEVFKRTMEE